MRTAEADGYKCREKDRGLMLLSIFLSLSPRIPAILVPKRGPLPRNIYTNIRDHPEFVVLIDKDDPHIKNSRTVTLTHVT